MAAAMQTWLLISHCQTFGLANSLNLLAPDVAVEALDVWAYRRDIAAVHDKLAAYERVIVYPEVLDTPGADFSAARRLDVMPGLHFRGYHPDLCYATAGVEMLQGPAAVYHSMIVIAAFNRGLSAEDTIRLFNAASFEACGYMDVWQTERDALLATFNAVGIDLARDLRRWSVGPPFMYSINHPRIFCLYDLAHAYLAREGIETLRGDVLPPDNLAQNTCFAVYPEIGERIGVEGNYLFKSANTYRSFTLDTFVRASFDTYAHFGRGNIVPDHTVHDRFPALDVLF
jgi:hypothetical protein